MAWKLLTIQNNVTLVVMSRYPADNGFAFPRWRNAQWFCLKWRVISLTQRAIQKICKKVLNYGEVFFQMGKLNFYCYFPLTVVIIKPATGIFGLWSCAFELIKQHEDRKSFIINCFLLIILFFERVSLNLNLFFLQICVNIKLKEWL
jgi:hypothetical protein